MANVEAGNDKQLIIKDLVESYDLTIAANSAPGTICAVSTLENIYDKYGYHTLDHVLRLIIGTWEGESTVVKCKYVKRGGQTYQCLWRCLKGQHFQGKTGTDIRKGIKQNCQRPEKRFSRFCRSHPDLL